MLGRSVIPDQQGTGAPHGLMIHAARYAFGSFEGHLELLGNSEDFILRLRLRLRHVHRSPH